MKKSLFVLLAGLGVTLGAQQASAPPDIPFAVQDVIKMPPDLYLGEVAGVASTRSATSFFNRAPSPTLGRTHPNPPRPAS